MCRPARHTPALLALPARTLQKCWPPRRTPAVHGTRLMVHVDGHLMRQAWTCQCAQAVSKYCSQPVHVQLSGAHRVEALAVCEGCRHEWRAGVRDDQQVRQRVQRQSVIVLPAFVCSSRLGAVRSPHQCACHTRTASQAGCNRIPHIGLTEHRDQRCHETERRRIETLELAG